MRKKLNFYLIKNWLNNKNAKISHPNYIRDNIHIDLLSKMYKKLSCQNQIKSITFRQVFVLQISFLLKLCVINLKNFLIKKLKLLMKIKLFTTNLCVELMEIK